MPTIDQRRASHALRQIRDLADREYGHYVSYVSALPSTIVMSGLGQALATLLARARGKENDPHRLLYDHVASWLASGEVVRELEGEPATVIDRLMEHGQDVYVRAQVEAMAYLNWLKQFARAYLNESEQPE